MRAVTENHEASDHKTRMMSSQMLKKGSKVLSQAAAPGVNSLLAPFTLHIVINAIVNIKY